LPRTRATRRLEFPFNGAGVLEAAAQALPPGAFTATLLDIDDRGCLDLPEYNTSGCGCWFSGTAACSSPSAFCRNCTKARAAGWQ
jgi:hypothetical protein